MATTSTVPLVIDALLSTINDDLDDVTAYPFWPGPNGEADMVVLGDITWDEYKIATIKAGRQHRNEVYSVAFELVSLSLAGDTSPADPTATRDHAFEILASLEDVLALDPRAGLDADVVRQIEVQVNQTRIRQFEQGVGWLIEGQFNVTARLT